MAVFKFHEVLIQWKGRSSFRECELCYSKIRSLSVCSISCCTRSGVFPSFAPVKKRFNYCFVDFFQPLASDDFKVNKTQRVSTEICSELDSLTKSWCNLFQRVKHNPYLFNTLFSVTHPDRVFYANNAASESIILSWII